jgi:hypothetical protein
MEHRFAPVKRLWWRNSDLDFGSVARLIASLEERTEDEWLTRGREADDLMALKALAEREEVAVPHRRCARRAASVGRLPHPGFPRGSAMPNMPICWAASSVFCMTAARARRLAGAAGPADRPNRRRHRHIVEAVGIYPHMDLRGATHGLG